MRHQNSIKNTKAYESKRGSFYSTKFLEIQNNCQSESIKKKKEIVKNVYFTCLKIHITSQNLKKEAKHKSNKGN